MKQVVIEKYDPNWVTRFEEERRALASVLPVHVVIEHIGSTSVVGLDAKPIVDILIGVASLTEADAMVPHIAALGFEYVPEFEDALPQRRYLRKDSPEGVRLTHIHMVATDTPFWRNHLYFRNRLRGDADLARRYESLKYELAERYRFDREAYTDAKTNFIMAVVNEQVQKAREKTQVVAHEHLSKGDKMGWFDDLYKQAEGDPSNIPWAKGVANPYLVTWLDKTATVGNGKKALVIGCGLGDDAEELSRRGFDVTAFDISETAIDWAKKRFPETNVHFEVADLFEISKRRAGEFDFIYECYTVQALPRDLRTKVIEAVIDFLAPKGELLLVTRRWRGEGLQNGPPWPLTDDEMKLFSDTLKQESTEEFWEDDNTIRKERCLFKKA